MIFVAFFDFVGCHVPAKHEIGYSNPKQAAYLRSLADDLERRLAPPASAGTGGPGLRDRLTKAYLDDRSDLCDALTSGDTKAFVDAVTALAAHPVEGVTPQPVSPCLCTCDPQHSATDEACLVCFPKPAPAASTEGLGEAPWTLKEVIALTARQKDGRKHPYTCKCGEILIPNKDGWWCSSCVSVVQTWAHASDLDAALRGEGEKE